MKSQFFGHGSTALSTSAVNYFPASGARTAPNATEANVNRCVFACQTVVSNFYFLLDVAPGGSANYTMTIRKNGVDTGVTVTITGAALTATDATHSVVFAAGDVLTIGCTPASTPSAPTVVNWNYTVDTVGNTYTPIMGGVLITTGLSTSSVTYGNLTGLTTFTEGWASTELDKEIVIPCAGTLDSLYTVLSGTPGGSANYVITLVKNGSASALTCTVTSSATTATDLTHAISVAAGDTLSISVTPSGTPTARFMGWGLRFTPSINGQSFFGFGSASVPSQTTTQYEIPFGAGSGGWNSTLGNRQIVLGACTLSAMYVVLGVAPGALATRTFTVYKGASPTSITVPITGVSTTTGSITAQTVSVSQGDLVSLQCLNSTTPSILTDGVHTGILMYFAPSVISRGLLGMGIFT